MGTFLPVSVSPLLTNRFVNVLHWVAELHDRQIREAHNIPHISHLLAVAALTIEEGTILLPEDLLEDAAIVALMHHTVEDIGLPLDLFESIGSTVQAAIKLLCEENPRLKATRNQHYLDRLSAASGTTAAIARLVAAADHLDHLRFYSNQGQSAWKPEHGAFYQHFLAQISVPSAWKFEMNGLLKGLQRPASAAVSLGSKR